MTCQAQGLMHTKWHDYQDTYYYHHYSKKLNGKQYISSSCFLCKLHNCKLRPLLFDYLHGVFPPLHFKNTSLRFWHKACVLIYKPDWAWPSLNPQVEASIPLPGMQSVWPTYAWTRLVSVQSSLVSGHRLAAAAFTSIMISSYMGRSIVIPGNQPS